MRKLSQFLTQSPETVKLFASYREAFDKAITANETLRLNYQGNPRHIIPLASGMLKCRKEALLCYKILGEDNGIMDIAIRLYHWSKISDIEPTGISMPMGKQIDYYLTNHFKSIYTKIS